MSVVLTTAVAWIAASVVVAVGWMLLAVHLRRRRAEEEHPCRPPLPRQRIGEPGEERRDHGHPAA
ncbi:MAG TPA: hypothetical protein VEX15_01135 [Nocardioidaceae bacterium]|nr:hypothetical protein [Nocardioidaceae bacterium]